MKNNSTNNKLCNLNKQGACIYKINQTKLEESKIHKLSQGITPNKSELKARSFECKNCCVTCFFNRCSSVDQFCRSGRLLKEFDEIKEIFDALKKEYIKKLIEKGENGYG